MEVTVVLTAQMPVKIEKRERWFLASCPILDVHSQGETEEKAKENLAEALTLFFTSCFERGTLDTVFKQCGFRPIRPPAKYEERSILEREDYIDVPIPFLVSQADRSECHRG